MAATCPKCLEQLPRQVLWKGLKSGTLDKAEIVCPQCRQVLRITPKSLATILALAILPDVPITLWFIFFLAPASRRNRHPGFPGSDAPDEYRPADCLVPAAGPVSRKAQALLHQGLTDAGLIHETRRGQCYRLRSGVLTP